MIRTIQNNIMNLSSCSILHRIYAARDITTPCELNYDLQYLLPFYQLKDIDGAVQCLIDTIINQYSVLIIGDFDVDGAASTALAVLALKEFGLQNIAYIIPNRFDHGYGLSSKIIDIVVDKKPHLLVTVDNGISSIDGVKIVRDLGIKVIITDHHLPQNNILPQANAIINPNQTDDIFPSKNLAGVGVIFYLMMSLRAGLRKINWFKEKKVIEPNMAQFLDLVMLGTIADTVQLDYNNRILVTNGLNRIRLGKCREGIKALFKVSHRDYSKASMRDISFIIIPKLNAAGRLDDMSLSVECLLTADIIHAQFIAKKLDDINNKRRLISEEMQKNALNIINKFQTLPFGICMFEESWHQGIIGIVSSRLKEKFNRPVIIFTTANDNEIRGSVRSIDKIHIVNVLNNISINNPGLIIKYGGHAMAAGITIAKENYIKFIQIFNRELQTQTLLEDLEKIIYTDGELPNNCFNIETAELLENAGPWGSGFPEPIFVGEFSVLNIIKKKNYFQLFLCHTYTNQLMKAVCFNTNYIDQLTQMQNDTIILITYSLGIWNNHGKKNLQLTIYDIVNK